MTADAASEQGSAGLDHMPQSDADAFDRLNPACREKFGFPFIIAVRGRGQAEEEAAALAKVGASTRMRLERLVSE